ncbi:response regulator transcription factor [Kineosporia sp. J2-2]|uniref:Response regulator transcription factor n=1 Tax=Kineosporia corallincola TaxID=2835133 RepID=A0ABS5TGI9_9ACTN|nr:hypothetical protein [Kineosporia corallincola]MBT0769499.1 response regulator transcription factor [Kineosporia corallincola]
MDLPALYSSGLRHALAGAGLRQVVISSLDGLVGAVPPEDPFVVVVPRSRVAGVSRALGQEVDGTRCAVVELVETMSGAEFADAVARGSLGVVEMDADPEIIVEAVRSAARGQFLVPEVARQLLARSDAEADVPALGTEEIEWLRRLGQGVTVAALAHAAAYSEREMYRVLSRVYQRLGAASRTQALLNAQRWGLLDE